MDATVIPFFFLFPISILFLFSFYKNSNGNTKKKTLNLPPSPPSFPILGHLHLLKQPLHQALAKLSEAHGPVLRLKLGMREVLLVSSAAVAEECFTTHDVAFANRPESMILKHISYDYRDLGSSSYGPHWRNVRRMFTLELFSSQRLQSFSSLRNEEGRRFVRGIYRLCREQRSSLSFVEVRPRMMIFDNMFNIIMRTLTGKRYFGEGVEDKEEAKFFEKIVQDCFDLLGAVNIGDYLPVPQWILGLKKKLDDLHRRRDQFLQGLVDEIRATRSKDGDEKRNKTIVDVMLGVQEDDPLNFTDDVLKAMVANLILASVETTVVTTEWAMALLINNPEAMKVAREEIDAQVRPGKIVDEDDLSHLPYIHAVTNETLRLFPAAPLLVPHRSSEDTVVDGFDIPKGTTLIVNAWAIHRDEQLWKDPTKFMPERFLRQTGNDNDEGERVTKSVKLLPFGYGRRRCPGESMAFKVVGLALASMIQCFDWDKVGGVDVDMEEGTGLAMPKAVPLVGLCRTRESMATLLDQLYAAINHHGLA